MDPIDVTLNTDKGCLALVVIELYQGFVGHDGSTTALAERLEGESALRRVFTWPCQVGSCHIGVRGAPAVDTDGATFLAEGEIDAQGWLHLTTLDSLGVLATCEEARLPRPDDAHRPFALPTGRYRVRVMEAARAAAAAAGGLDSEGSPHYVLEFRLIAKWPSLARTRRAAAGTSARGPVSAAEELQMLRFCYSQLLALIAAATEAEAAAKRSHWAGKLRIATYFLRRLDPKFDASLPIRWHGLSPEAVEEVRRTHPLLQEGHILREPRGAVFAAISEQLLAKSARLQQSWTEAQQS